MQGRVMPIEIAFERFDPRCKAHALPPPRRRRAGLPGVQRFDLLSDGAYDRFTIAIDVRDHDEPLVEVFPLKALADDIKRGLLLANHKKRLLPANGIGDHIDDRLALARARRPFDNESWRGAGFKYRCFLRGVAVCGEKAVDFTNTWLSRGAAISVAKPKRCFKGSARRQTVLEPSEVLDDRLAHEVEVKKDCRWHKLWTIGRYSDVRAGERRE